MHNYLVYMDSDQFRHAKQRNNIILEILETERTFVNYQTIFIEHLLKPLKERCKDPKKLIIDDATIKKLFSNVEQILGINKTFLDALEKGMINFPQVQSFGANVKNIAPFFKTYTVYVNNYKAAFDLHESLEKTNAKYRDFLADQYSKKELNRHKFDSFLIMPVQRLPRYKMLFEQVLKYTPDGHIEKSNIADALVKVAEIADFVNTNAKTIENQKVLVGLSSMYKDKYPTLVQPFRQYRAESNVNVVYPDKKILNQPHTAYLFADMLILVDVKKKKNVYFIILSYSTIGKSDGPCELRLDALSEGCKRQINLTFPTDTEKTDWEKMIVESVANELKNVENKGIKFQKDLVGFGQERIELCNVVDDKKNKMSQIGKEFTATSSMHFKLDSEIIQHERQVEELMKRIALEKEKKTRLEEDMFLLHRKQLDLKDEMAKNLGLILQKDSVYYESLKNEVSAFVATFNEKPSTKEEHEILLSKFPPLQLPRTASQRMSMSIPALGPKKSLPPTPPSKMDKSRSMDLRSDPPPIPVNRRQSVMPVVSTGGNIPPRPQHLPPKSTAPVSPVSDSKSDFKTLSNVKSDSSMGRFKETTSPRTVSPSIPMKQFGTTTQSTTPGSPIAKGTPPPIPKKK